MTGECRSIHDSARRGDNKESQSESQSRRVVETVMKATTSQTPLCVLSRYSVPLDGWSRMRRRSYLTALGAAAAASLAGCNANATRWLIRSSARLRGPFNTISRRHRRSYVGERVPCSPTLLGATDGDGVIGDSCAWSVRGADRGRSGPRERVQQRQ
jgi:hypothetical protein